MRQGKETHHRIKGKQERKYILRDTSVMNRMMDDLTTENSNQLLSITLSKRRKNYISETTEINISFTIGF